MFKFSTTIEKSSRLRSTTIPDFIKSSRLRSITILNFVQVLDYDREIVLDQDREKSSTTIDNSPRSRSGSVSITIKNNLYYDRYISTTILNQLKKKKKKKKFLTLDIRHQDASRLRQVLTYHSLHSHYWSPHYMPISFIFFYRKWLGRTLQPEPPRGRNFRPRAALRPLMPLRAPPLNRWTPHYRVSTLGLRRRQVTVIYHSTLESIPAPPRKNCQPYL